MVLFVLSCSQSWSQPLLSGINKQETCDGQSILNIPIYATGDTLGLTFSTLSSNPSITPSFSFFGPANARKMNISTISGQIGATTIKVIATNNSGGKDTTAFQLECGNKTYGTLTLGPVTTVINPFNNLSSFAFGPDNNIYCTVGNSPGAPYTQGSIAKFSINGTLLNANYITGLSVPNYLHLGKDLKWYFTTSTTNINRYNGPTFEATKNSASTQPLSIQAKSSSEVFYLEYTSTGGVLSLPANFTNASSVSNLYSTSPNPVYLILDPSETKMYYIESANTVNSKVKCLQTDGSGSTVLLASPNIRYITFDDNGNFWMSHNGKLSMVNTTTGALTEVISSGFNINPTFKNGDMFFLDYSGSTAGVYKRSFVIPVTYTACNAKPTFSPATIANSSSCFSTSTITLPTQSITVSDSDGTIASSVVSSSNPTLIGVTNTGTSTNVVLNLTQFANQSGSAVIKVVSTDNLGAKDSISFTITVNSAVSPVTTITSNYNGSPISCNGAADGSVSVAVSGGVMPYTYLWSNGATTAVNSGLIAGTYSVVVTDANGCPATSNTVTVTEPGALSTSTITATQISCFGANNGAINVTPAGGTGFYSFAWTDGPLSEDRTGLTAGTYSVTISDANGCSAILNTTITEPVAIVSSMTQTACDSYTLNGQTYTTSGTYTQNLTAVNGCDSTLTLNLTVLNATSATISETACESVTVNGSTFTTSGTYTQFLTNAAGCDSTLTIEVTILEPTATTLTLSECDSLVLNGETFTTSGVYTQMLTNVAGCDSVLTINLSINNSVYDTITVEACGAYTFNGQTYTSTGVYDQTLVAANGCSLYQTLDVTIFPAVTVTAVYNGDSTFTATGADAYQWIDCITGQPIAGATSASFTATTNGDYAVIGTSADGCSDTTACITVDNLSTNINEQLSLVLAPNPTSNAVFITFNATTAQVVVYDAQGKRLQVSNIQSGEAIELGNYQTGVYLVKITTELGSTIERVVKR